MNTVNKSTHFVIHIISTSSISNGSSLVLVWDRFSIFVRGEHAQKPKFLVSFISFYFEILSYIACGEKIIRLASKNSVKSDEKSASDF